MRFLFRDRAVRRSLEDAQRRARDMTPVYRDWGHRMLNSVSQNFRVGGRPDRWAPLAQATILGRLGGKRKAMKRKGGMRAPAARKAAGFKTLVRSARLKNSISYRLISNGIEVGTNVVYAAIHQYGGKAGRGRSVTIPARPYLVVQDEDLRVMADAMERHIVSVF